MKNRALPLCFLVAIAGCFPFLSNTGTSSSNVGGNKISIDSMIGSRKGFIYGVEASRFGDSSTPIIVAELSIIINNIARLKPRVFGYIFPIDSYEIECLQEIAMRNGRLMRTNLSNFKQNIDAEPQEGQLIHIIAEKKLVSVPAEGTVMGTISGDVYRLESIKDLEKSDKFLVLTLSIIS